MSYHSSWNDRFIPVRMNWLKFIHIGIQLDHFIPAEVDSSPVFHIFIFYDGHDWRCGDAGTVGAPSPTNYLVTPKYSWAVTIRSEADKNVISHPPQ